MRSLFHQAAREHWKPLALIAGLTVGTMYWLSGGEPGVVDEEPHLVEEKEVQQPAPVAVKQVDPEAGKKAWARVEARLRRFDLESKDEAERAVKPLQDYFIQARRGAKPFAVEMLSWSGKYQVAASIIDSEGYKRTTRKRMEELVLKPDDLNRVIESVVDQFISNLLGKESQLLVEIQADLDQPDFRLGEAMRMQLEVIRSRYVAMLWRVNPDVMSRAQEDVAVDFAAFLTGEALERIVKLIAGDLASKLGINAALSGGGAAFSPTSMGISLVLSYLMGKVVDRILLNLGYDAENAIAERITTSLNRLEALIIDGDAGPEIWNFSGIGEGDGFDSRWNFGGSDSDSRASRPKPAAVDKPHQRSAPKPGSLLYLLNSLSKTRSVLRTAALKQLILEGGVQ